jgi:hypothetical protein
MGSLWKEMADDGPEFQETFGRPVVFRNANWSALISRAPVDQMLTEGGFTYNASWVIRFLAPTGSTLAGSPPTHGERITVFGKVCTILNVTSRPPSPWIDVLVGPAATV